MRFADSLLTALGSLRVNMLRSVLTTLGIIIGVAAVIVMVAVGAGAESRVTALIQSLGSNLIIVLPGSGRTGGVRLGRGTRPTITEGDAAAIAAEIPEVQLAAPQVRGGGQVIYGNLNWSTLIEGVTPDYIEARDWVLETGRGFTRREITGAAKVVLLGWTVIDNLFPGQNPIGETIRLNRVPFTVVGTLASKGQTPFGRDQDDVVMIPLSTAKKRVLGGRYLGGKTVAAIFVKVRNAAEVASAETEMRALLRQRHRIAEGGDDDFFLRNLSQILETRAESSRVMTLLLAAVALVSLVVGGIGIMNIMLVSVTERTREIGLRMAVGAKRRDILGQFLIEAVTLSLVGGVLGVALGLAGAQGIAAFGNWPMVVVPYSIVMAFGFAAAIGVFFGFYPARKAAGLDPIEALRYE